MRLISTSVFVDNQENALSFYTEILGFVLKTDIPAGDFRWLTVVSPSDIKGTELTLEPNVHPAAKDYQERLYADGIPANMFGVDDIHEEFNKLTKKEVTFTMEPTEMEGYKMAIFDDTCGNLIQIIEV